MADHHSQGTSEPQALSELLNGDRHVVMVMTMIGDTQTARPVTCLEVHDEQLSFLVGRSAHGWPPLKMAPPSLTSPSLMTRQVCTCL